MVDLYGLNLLQIEMRRYDMVVSSVGFTGLVNRRFLLSQPCFQKYYWTYVTAIMVCDHLLID